MYSSCRRLSIALFLPGLLLFAACFCAPSEPAVRGADWRRIYSADGAEVFILKGSGRSNLLAYVGFRPAALIELEHARTAILKNGYNLLTFTLNNVTPSDDPETEATRRVHAIREFVDFAGQLSGYRKRVLVRLERYCPRYCPRCDHGQKIGPVWLCYVQGTLRFMTKFFLSL